MKNKSYKILFFNSSTSSAKEFNFSRWFLLFPLSVFVLANFALFYFFADDFIIFTSDIEIQNHKKNNQILVDNINMSEERMTHIEDKINTINAQDDNMRGFLKLTKIHQDVRMLGVGGDKVQQTTVEYLEYLLPEDENIDLQEYFNRLDFIERTTNLEFLSYMELQSNSEKNKNKLRHLPAIHPVDLSNAKLVSKFGYRRDPFSKKYKKHEGHDFSAKIGTDVMSTADGVIVSSRYNGTFGNYIEVSHGNGYKTVYGHLSKRLVKKGDYVVRGQKIGEVGNTGRSTAPHLHYEVKQYKRRLDPKDFYFENL